MKKLILMFILIVLMVFLYPVTATTVKNTKISHSTCDIVVKDIKTDPLIFRNKTVKISSSVKNLGNSSCKNFYLDYFLKSVDSGQNIYIGSKIVVGLGPGETRNLTASFKLPQTIRNTDYIVRIFADSTSQLNETNKTNNLAYSQKKLSVVTGRPVYITSDCIKNNAKDNARIDAIVNGLKKMGLYAMNYGLGPNKHYSVLKNIQIPQNALVVNIYGGACAGTIWEMTKPYYKKALGTRKVFSIWINTNINIKTLKFLKRASDDNVTPKYGEKGGFPQFQDSNNNGIFEPELGEKDGLANPGKLLDDNGYKYLYQKDGNVDMIIKAIYYQATN
jgi:hypothetical protein